MRTSFLFFLILLGGVIRAQTTDYKIYRNQKQHPTCTVLDSAIVNDLASQLHIDIQIFEQNGVQKAAAMALHAPKSAYSAYKRRFDYIILNTPKIHAPDQAAARKKLFELYPDTLELKAEYLRLLITDSSLSSNLLTMMQAIDAKGQGSPKAQFSQAQFFEVASRFFFIDSIAPDGKIQTHICIGINGQAELEKSAPFELLAAFCYEAIFTDFDKEVSVIDQVFEQHRKEISEQIIRGKKRQPLHFYQQRLFQKMAKDVLFQQALLAYYQIHRANLAFEIQ